MSIRFLSAKVAAAVDEELMSSGAFSIDQLMELAGLSVAQAVYKVQPPQPGRNKVLILAGPGNNGGDGLVAARHLKLLGYAPMVYYPKKSKGELFERLEKQLHNFGIPFIDDDLTRHFNSSHHIVDALFGFSFKPPVREPFPAVIDMLTHTKIPVTSVDIPSSWSVDNGPENGITFHPDNLISLTAPKTSAKYFRGRHFLGGRFISEEFAAKYEFDVPKYPGIDQVVELPKK